MPAIRLQNLVGNRALIAGLLTAALTAGRATSSVAPTTVEPEPEAATLYVLPLPAAHLRLGPLTLRDALLTLAGPAWELSVDDVTRQVCFSRHGAPTFLSVDPPGTATPVPDADRHEEMQP